MCISIVIIEALFDELPYLRRRSDSFGVLVDSHRVPPCQERLQARSRKKFMAIIHEREGMLIDILTVTEVKD